jgi:UDP-glucose:(heptosyl)LPS alpha-1,3-glucosyltransferase
MQFIHKRWNLERRRLNPQPFSRRLKESVQCFVDVLSERLVVALNRQALYVAISEQVRADLRQLYGLENIVTIRHGVNLDEFKPLVQKRSVLRESLGIPAERKLLLFVGAFERKGLFYLLKALRAPFSAHRDWDLVVVGQGRIEYARALCRNHGIENRVYFLGGRTNVAQYYAACDLFILPSLYDPFGLVAIEALASGCPAIVSRDSGSFDLLEEGVNGWGLNDASDTQELGRVVGNAFSHHADLGLMRAKARQSVANESWREKIEQYRQVYVAATRPS